MNDKTVYPGLNIIYARSLNHCIGKDGGLPWRLPEEYAHFEAMTHGWPVIMGRRSYLDHDGLLANSANIVVSSNPNLLLEPGALLARDLVHAIELAQDIAATYFVIGGAGLLDEAIPQANAVFETIVDTDIDGDTFLTPFDFAEWHSELLIDHSTDKRHVHAFRAWQHARPDA